HLNTAAHDPGSGYSQTRSTSRRTLPARPQRRRPGFLPPHAERFLSIVRLQAAPCQTDPAPAPAQHTALPGSDPVRPWQDWAQPEPPLATAPGPAHAPWRLLPAHEPGLPLPDRGGISTILARDACALPVPDVRPHDAAPLPGVQLRGAVLRQFALLQLALQSPLRAR